jgi:hypothetical protein
MFAGIGLVLSLALSPVDTLSRLELLGTWTVVGTVSDDGKVVEDTSGAKFMISHSTLSLYSDDALLWAATYTVDASRSPKIVHASVFRAPCLSGNTELDAPFSFDGKRLNLGGLLLERRRLP